MLLGSGFLTFRGCYVQEFLPSGILTFRSSSIQGFLRSGAITSMGSYVRVFLHSRVFTSRVFFLRSGLLMFQGSHVKGVLYTGILTLAPCKILTTNSKVRISISCLLFTLRVNVTRHYPLFRFDQSGACACEYHVLHHSL